MSCAHKCVNCPNAPLIDFSILFSLSLLLPQSYPLSDYVFSSFSFSLLPFSTITTWPDNLADYCSEENWSDYPGRHRIRLEKTVKIRRPSIVDFHYNETHRARLGTNGGSVHGPRYSLIDSGARYGSQQQQQQSEGPNFVPYCLLSFTVAERGYRIYAEGFATGKWAFERNICIALNDGKIGWMIDWGGKRYGLFLCLLSPTLILARLTSST